MLFSLSTIAISNDELAQIFAMLGVKITKEQVSAVIKKVDQNADGQLSFEEFLTIMSHQPKSTQSDAYLIAAFKSYDKDGDGYITRAELRESLAKTGETLSEAELQRYVCDECLPQTLLL